MDSNNQQNQQQRGHRRSQTDSMMTYSLGSMSQDFLGGGNVLGGTFDDLDVDGGGIEISTVNAGEDIGPALVGNKHMRSMSFTDSRDMGDSECNSDIFIMNTNANGTSEIDAANMHGNMSPPHGVPYRQKKATRSKGYGMATSAGASHRRVKSMSSASNDQMIMDCFLRDPSVSVQDLPDLGSMSMESSELLRFTSEDWQEAFIQIGGDHDVDSVIQPGMNSSSRRSTDSSYGISVPGSYSPTKESMRPPNVPRGHDVSGRPSGIIISNMRMGGNSGSGPSNRSSSGHNNPSNAYRDFHEQHHRQHRQQQHQQQHHQYYDQRHPQHHHQQRQHQLQHSNSHPSHIDMPLQDGYSHFMQTHGQHYPAHINSQLAARTISSTGSSSGSFNGLGAGGENIRAGISDPEYHNAPGKGKPMNADYLETDKKSSNRGKYRCGRCGQPKVNHQCPYEIETSTRSISCQVVQEKYDDSSHPFLTEKTLVVRRRPAIVHMDTMSCCSDNMSEYSDVGSIVSASTASSAPALSSVSAGETVLIANGGGQNSTQYQQDVKPVPFVKNEPTLQVSIEVGQNQMLSKGYTSVKRSPSHLQMKGQLNPNVLKSTSSDSSIYNDILKDIRIVHPSMQRQEKHQTHNISDNCALTATVSTDDSDTNSLFLSSLSSNASVVEENL